MSKPKGDFSPYHPGGDNNPIGHRVFEVTNLIIPAGTDWSDTTFYELLPEIVLDIHGGGFLVGLYLESVEPLEADNTITLDASFLTASLEAGTSWCWKSTAERFGFGPPPDPAPIKLYASLTTPGPTTADIHIVLARAAFLII